MNNVIGLDSGRGETHRPDQTRIIHSACSVVNRCKKLSQQQVFLSRDHSKSNLKTYTENTERKAEWTGGKINDILLLRVNRLICTLLSSVTNYFQKKDSLVNLHLRRLTSSLSGIPTFITSPALTKCILYIRYRVYMHACGSVQSNKSAFQIQGDRFNSQMFKISCKTLSGSPVSFATSSVDKCNIMKKSS
jgi:hypothetical protein